MHRFNTLSLIGMPGVGKSTVGVILAKQTGLRFVDTDLDIQVREGATLQTIIEQHDYRYLRRVEEEVLLDIDLGGALISTGGSVVYSAASMQRLQQAGPVIYLQADLQTLQQRVAAAPLRGIASDSKQSFAQVYAERTPLYAQYADHTVDATQGGPEAVATAIRDALENPATD
ncbi:shikimate kinase [Pseudohalioglobus sediminis]|uniref:Shikimate kinase n=1 Tax=Pseudohalioglobus sediminis TaxID=2606449 RepID=A0A5B0X0Z2_9GAMM|nr:shikimate kinase [Pseudohalioglobus sediminis]KAA1191769.1 shikimate kinase [Pseudohalioglobus sediminis]